MSMCIQLLQLRLQLLQLRLNLSKNRETLLALARTIRQPRAYVGYSAFILMGLVYKCRPYAWEGPSLIDLIQVFAPWAEELCTQECPVQTIPCALVATEGCYVERVPFPRHVLSIVVFITSRALTFLRPQECVQLVAFPLQNSMLLSESQLF